MPNVNCPTCGRLAVLVPYDPKPVACLGCGGAVAPYPVPPPLRLTPEECERMGRGNDSRREPFPDWYQLLRFAVFSGETWRVKWELVDGADPNLAPPRMPYPLHDAAGAGRADVVRLLLAAGADPGNLDGDRLTPEEVAARRGHGEVAEILRRAVAPRMFALSLLYPLNFLLACFFTPVPVGWGLLACGNVGGALGFAAFGFALQFAFGHGKRFEQRSRMVSYTLLMGGGVCVVGAAGLGLFFAAVGRASPETGVLVKQVVLFAAAGAAVFGLGYLQLRLTPGDGSSDDWE